MNDLIIYQDKIENLFKKYNDELNLNIKNNKNMKNLIIKIEDEIQNIIATSKVWDIEERKESKEYITNIRIKLVEIKSKIEDFEEDSNDLDTLLINEKIPNDENNLKQNNSNILFILKYILLIIIIFCTFYIFYQLWW